MADDVLNPITDDGGDPIWEIAGYTDWEGEYHKDPDLDSLDFDNIDMVTIAWTDAADGTVQYANLVGPWEDLDDLDDTVDTYFEEGTP